MKAPEQNAYLQPGALAFEPVETLSEAAAKKEARELSEALHYHGHYYYVRLRPHGQHTL